MNNSQNTKRKLISKRLVDVSSLVAELRSKNPFPKPSDVYEEPQYYGYEIAVDELERILKSQRISDAQETRKVSKWVLKEKKVRSNAV